MGHLNDMHAQHRLPQRPRTHRSAARPTDSWLPSLRLALWATLAVVTLVPISSRWLGDTWTLIGVVTATSAAAWHQVRPMPEAVMAPVRRRS